MTLASRSNETASLTPTPRELPRSWTREEALALYEAPFNDLLFRAQTVHRQHFDPNKVQLSRLLSIKTGGCPEDCGYSSQSSHHASGLKALGMETCMTLGMLDRGQAKRLGEAGLDYYNHNIDTSERHYDKIISTH